MFIKCFMVQIDPRMDLGRLDCPINNLIPYQFFFDCCPVYWFEEVEHYLCGLGGGEELVPYIYLLFISKLIVKYNFIHRAKILVIYDGPLGFFIPYLTILLMFRQYLNLIVYRLVEA